LYILLCCGCKPAMNLLLVFMFRGKQDSNVVTLKQVYKTAEFFAYSRVRCISEIKFPRFFVGVYLSCIACNYHSIPCFLYWFSSGVIAKFVMLGSQFQIHILLASLLNTSICSKSQSSIIFFFLQFLCNNKFKGLDVACMMAAGGKGAGEGPNLLAAVCRCTLQKCPFSNSLVF